MSKNIKKLQIADPMREFYAAIEIIKEMYINQGYKKRKTLYLVLKEKYNWEMSYSTFTRYFNKEIKNSHSSTPIEESKKKENNENSYQYKKEITDDKETSTLTTTKEEELKKRLEEELANSKYFEVEEIGRRLREERQKKENEKKDENDENDKNNSGSK